MRPVRACLEGGDGLTKRGLAAGLDGALLLFGAHLSTEVASNDGEQHGAGLLGERFAARAREQDGGGDRDVGVLVGEEALGRAEVLGRRLSAALDVVLGEAEGDVPHGRIVVAEGARDRASRLLGSDTNERDDGLVPHLGARVGERPLELGRGAPVAELSEGGEGHLANERVVVLDRDEQLRERRDRLRVGERGGRARPYRGVRVAEGLLERRDTSSADGLVDAPREVTAELFARLGASLHAGAHDVA
jgi:hypothetical protein